MIHIKSYQIDDESLPGTHYSGEKLEFSDVNYFIGMNGSLKTQLLWKIRKSSEKHGQKMFCHDPGKIFHLGGERFPVQGHITSALGGNEDERCAQIVQLMSPDERHQWENFLRNILIGLDFGISIDQETSKVAFSVQDTSRGSDVPVQERSATQAGPGTGVSEGTKELMLRMAYILHSASEFNIIGIDEPETHLHPIAIDQLMDMVMGQTESKQFFFPTHSPYALRIDSRCKYFFFYPLEEKITSLDGKDLQPLKWLFNYDSLRSFYWDKVLLVEGFEDFLIFEAIRQYKGWNHADRGVIFTHGTHPLRLPSGVEKPKMVLAADILYRAGKKIHAIIDGSSRASEISGELLQITADSAKVTKLNNSDILRYFTTGIHNRGDKVPETLRIADEIRSGIVVVDDSHDYYQALQNFWLY